MKRTGPTSLELKNLIDLLRMQASKEKVRIWQRVADDLSYSTRRRREVNLSRINNQSKSKETIIVPGKVLGTGDITKDIKIAAWHFSKSAKDKLGNNAISLAELIKGNPKGKGCRIIG